MYVSKEGCGKSLLYTLKASSSHLSVAVPTSGGGGVDATGAPQKLNKLFFCFQFLIRMLKNEAQISRESIKTTPELAKGELGSALVM